MDEEELCGKCKKKFDKGQQDEIGCEGVCQKWFHSKCVKISGPEMQLIKKNTQLKWMCEDCNGQYVHLIDTSIKKIMNEVMETMKLNMEQMVTKKMSEFLNKNMVSHMKKAEGNKVLLSDIVKGTKKEEVLIVHPKKTTQTSDTTKKICKESLNPTELKIGIENVRKIRNGGIAITCKSKEIQKVNAEVMSKLGRDYTTKIPELRKPRLRIFYIEEEMEDEELKKAIRNQNPDTIKEDSEIGIKINKKSKNSYIVVIEVDAQTFTRVMEEQRLKIKWQRCQVKEYVGISRCMKCYSYDHWNEGCPNGNRCVKCGGKHMAKECKTNEVKCSNCKDANEKLQLNLDINHSVLDQECPVYQRKLRRKRMAIRYEER